jgi:hypothetical protein
LLRVVLVFKDIIYIIIILYSWYLVIYEHFGRMYGIIDPGSCIRWVLGFGIKTGYDIASEGTPDAGAMGGYRPEIISGWKSAPLPAVGAADGADGRTKSASECMRLGGSGTCPRILCGNSWLVKNIGFGKQTITGELSMGASVLAQTGRSLGSNRTSEEYLAPAVEFNWEKMGKHLHQIRHP